MRQQLFVVQNVWECAGPTRAGDQAAAIGFEAAFRASHTDYSNQKFASRAIRKQAD